MSGRRTTEADVIPAIYKLSDLGESTDDGTPVTQWVSIRPLGASGDDQEVSIMKTGERSDQTANPADKLDLIIAAAEDLLPGF